jgi:hypothetical protein
VDALRVIAPGLAGLPVTIPRPAGQDDQMFQTSSAALGDDFVVKFAWSQAAARFILHQITILETLALEPAVPYLPEVAAARTSPLILVTRRVRGMSLFDAVDRIDRNHAGEQLARFLAALHSDQTRRRAEAAVGPIPAWYPLVTTAVLREGFGRLVTPGQQRAVERWCHRCSLSRGTHAAWLRQPDQPGPSIRAWHQGERRRAEHPVLACLGRSLGRVPRRAERRFAFAMESRCVTSAAVGAGRSRGVSAGRR